MEWILESIKRWHRECLAKNLILALENKGYNAIYASDADEARQIVNDLIPQDSTVAVGGSVTLVETGILADLQSDKYKFIDRYNQPSFDIILDKYREGYNADYFVTSTNAITKSAELVNLDCTGNRVGAIGFGPKNVIVVCGTNKIVRDINAGILRAKEIAPINAKRLNHKTPCAEDGMCHDCTVGHRLCNITSIIHNCYKFKGRITVVIIPDIIGY